MFTSVIKMKTKVKTFVSTIFMFVFYLNFSLINSPTVAKYLTC